MQIIITITDQETLQQYQDEDLDLIINDFCENPKVWLRLGDIRVENEGIRSMEEYQRRYYPGDVGKLCPYCGKKLNETNGQPHTEQNRGDGNRDYLRDRKERAKREKAIQHIVLSIIKPLVPIINSGQAYKKR